MEEEKIEEIKCARCGYSGKGPFYSVENLDLCEDCYNCWTHLERHIFRQFLGEIVSVERERKNVI